MAGILEGLKVMDMGQAEAIPAAGALLADWGAEVIKIEPPSGDQTRGLRSDQGVSVSRFNTRIELNNRNKRSLAVDLKKESGRDIFYRLVQRADIFMSNFRVSALKRLKADYACLNQINPGLIYVLVTGYGTVGPDKEEPGFDSTAGWARGGILYLMTEPGHPPPRGPSGMVDRATAGYAVAGILAALLHREKTGEGQELEFSLYQTAVWLNSNNIQSALVGFPEPPFAHAKVGNPMWASYLTKDKRWLQLAMTQADRYWPAFCRAIDKPELENDPRFNNMETRTQHHEELIGIVDEVFASKNSEEWEERFRKHNLIYGRVATPLEVATDPQALVNDFFAEIDHPTLGKVKLVNTPVKFHQTPASVRTRCPEIGQHTEEILLELGYSWDDIARLKEQEVIL